MAPLARTPAVAERRARGAAAGRGSAGRPAGAETAARGREESARSSSKRGAPPACGPAFQFQVAEELEGRRRDPGGRCARYGDNGVINTVPHHPCAMAAAASRAPPTPLQSRRAAPTCASGRTPCAGRRAADEPGSAAAAERRRGAPALGRRLLTQLFGKHGSAAASIGRFRRPSASYSPQPAAWPGARATRSRRRRGSASSSRARRRRELPPPVILQSPSYVVLDRPADAALQRRRRLIASEINRGFGNACTSCRTARGSRRPPPVRAGALNCLHALQSRKKYGHAGPRRGARLAAAGVKKLRWRLASSNGTRGLCRPVGAASCARTGTNRQA